METSPIYAPDLPSVHLELGNLAGNSGTIDIDDGLLLGDFRQFPWDMGGQLGLGDMAVRPVKRRRLHQAIGSAAPNYQPASLASNIPPTPPQVVAQPVAPVQNYPNPLPDTVNSLLPQILEIFPDVRHSYVEELISRQKEVMSQSIPDDVNSHAPISDQMVIKDIIIEQILENGPYPKQEKTKRKQVDEDECEWKPDTPYNGNSVSYCQIATQILAKEFPSIPMQHIRQVVLDKKRLYHSYLALFSEENLPLESERSYDRLKKRRASGALSFMPSNGTEFVFMDDLKRELNTARRKVEREAAFIRKRMEEEEAEKRNEEEHTQAGNLIECQCCFLDVPMNRSIPCEGLNVHFFCFSCIRRSAETQVGLMKYKLHCFDVSGCEAMFARYQLEEALGSSLMEKIDSLQQLDEVENAHLEGLEDCPFCSFKAVYPPVEEDREFRCENPTCEVVSCRLCKEKSHIPLTCQEARKEKGLSERHEVEEAMSKALIRSCPRCQVKIVKEFGCNKMTCTKCGCMMCYICGKNITQEKYKHFGHGPNACTQDDPHMEDRYQREVQQAQATAIGKILAENPGLTEEELRVQHPTPPSRNLEKSPHPIPVNLAFPRIHRPAIYMPPAQVIPNNQHQPYNQGPPQYEPPFMNFHVPQQYRPAQETAPHENNRTLNITRPFNGMTLQPNSTVFTPPYMPPNIPQPQNFTFNTQRLQEWNPPQQRTTRTPMDPGTFYP